MTTSTRLDRPPLNGDEERLRLLALVEVEGVVPQLAKDVDDTEMTWPHLVIWEFIAAAVFLVVLLAVSWLVNAPLVDHANPSLTPNPAKAPWYFLNLQELLVHMHPTLAGVVVPGAAVLLLMAIPFVDTSPQGVGRYFDSSRGVQIALFSGIYAAALNVVMVLFNEFVGVRRMLDPLGVPTFIIEYVIPMGLMVGLPAIQVALVRKIWKGANTRDILIALFFAFVSTFLTLTIIGTAFRGPGMHLVWPWQLHAAE
ncbi:MAG: menaquinol-cytochrome C reductase [Chloroflexota bacterium]|nr:MAG: menaquinol-cytochrome C reductase [Chloroflexota bacterium]